MRCLLVLSFAVAGKPSAIPATEKLAGVEKSLTAIVKSSAALADLVQPMVDEAHAALATKKEAACAKVLSEFPKWRAQMSKRQTELASAGDSERTALLVSVLQNRQSATVEEQMAVVASADFQGLPVVDFITMNSDGKTPLVSLALKFLDGEDTKSNSTSAEVRKAEPKDPTGLTAIIQQLQKHEARAEAQVGMLMGRENKLKELFKKAGEKKEGTGLNTPAGKFLERKELRKVEKRLATEQGTEKALQKAIGDIKHKDLKGLTEAKTALQASMDAMLKEQEEASGEFLHFLQTDAKRQPTGSFSCPYCGAQCVEKCRTNEHKSYSGCLTECIALNPVEGK